MRMLIEAKYYLKSWFSLMTKCTNDKAALIMMQPIPVDGVAVGDSLAQPESFLLRSPRLLIHSNVFFSINVSQGLFMRVVVL